MPGLISSDYILLAICAALQEADTAKARPDLTDQSLSERVEHLLGLAGCGSDEWGWRAGLPAGWYFDEVDQFTGRLVVLGCAYPSRDHRGVVLTQSGDDMIVRLLRKISLDPDKQPAVARLASAIGFRADDFLARAG